MYFCGAYAVWYALQYYGLQVSINDIISQMGIYEKGYSSIADIVAILDNRGISAKAVKISFENIEKVKMPFIQYLHPAGGSSLGHFVLCIPAGKGKFVVLDGENEPKLVDISVYKADNITQTRWDGTAVLIDGIKEDFKQSLISWRISLLGSRFWLSSENVSDRFVSQILSDSEVKLALGGWSDWDCFELAKNCNTNNICDSNDDCEAGKFVCQDDVIEEMCLLTPSGSIPCTYDLAHYCQPIKQQSGICGTPGQRCGWWPPNYGLCYPKYSARRWIYQCHDGW